MKSGKRARHAVPLRDNINLASLKRGGYSPSFSFNASGVNGLTM